MATNWQPGDPEMTLAEFNAALAELIADAMTHPQSRTRRKTLQRMRGELCRLAICQSIHAQNIIKLRRICAWCSTDMDSGLPVTEKEAHNPGISHGICPACLNAQKEVLAKMKNLTSKS